MRDLAKFRECDIEGERRKETKKKYRPTTDHCSKDPK